MLVMVLAQRKHNSVMTQVNLSRRLPIYHVGNIVVHDGNCSLFNVSKQLSFEPLFISVSAHFIVVIGRIFLAKTTNFLFSINPWFSSSMDNHITWSSWYWCVGAFKHVEVLLRQLDSEFLLKCPSAFLTMYGQHWPRFCPSTLFSHLLLYFLK